MKLSRVGVDLAKNVYQLHGVERWLALTAISLHAGFVIVRNAF